MSSKVLRWGSRVIYSYSMNKFGKKTNPETRTPNPEPRTRNPGTQTPYNPPMIRVGIVADDLTGAADTASQFVRAGWSTELQLRPGKSEAQVVAATTDSRNCDVAAAAGAVTLAVRRLREVGVTHLYKENRTRRFAVRSAPKFERRWTAGRRTRWRWCALRFRRWDERLWMAGCA